MLPAYPLKEDKSATVKDLGYEELEVSFRSWNTTKQSMPLLYNTFPNATGALV